MGRKNGFERTRRTPGVFLQHNTTHKNAISFLFAALVTGLIIAACASTPLASGTQTVPADTSPTDVSTMDTPISTGTTVPAGTETAANTVEAPTTEVPSPSPTSALAAACNGAPATVSPDGKWVLCDAKDANGLSIPYRVSTSGKRWNVSFKQIAGPVPVYDDNKVLVWTPDDHYVYVLLHGESVSVGRSFYAGSDVWRMDLSTGAIQDLLPTGQNSFESNFYDLSASPDGKRLAYVNQWQTPLMLDLLDLPGDTENEIKLADTKPGNQNPVTAGELTWTPDGKKLIYKLLTGQALNQCAYTYSILIMDLGSRSTQTIIMDQSVALCNGVPEEYHVVQVDDQEIILEHKGTMWRYDITANKLESQAAQTATP